MRYALLTMALLSCLLASCGFHLRGVVELPPAFQRIYVQSEDPYSQVVKNLKRTLQFSGAKLTNTAKEANIILEILHEDKSEQLLSVGSTQETRQYNLVLSVTFALTDANGKTILSPQTVSEIRAITIQVNQILGGNNEANNLYQQMRSAIASNIMNRLASKNVTDLLANTTNKK